MPALKRPSRGPVNSLALSDVFSTKAVSSQEPEEYRGRWRLTALGGEMKAIHLLGKALPIVLSGLALVHASDFVGVYARIDKVLLEPNSDSPERIQVWGVFSLASTHDGQTYLPASRGYLYFKLDRNPQAARAEWNDLKQIAGTGQIVAFGGRGMQPRLRKADENPESPDPYYTNIGLTKVNGKTDYPPVKAILDYKD